MYAIAQTSSSFPEWLLLQCVWHKTVCMSVCKVMLVVFSSNLWMQHAVWMSYCTIVDLCNLFVYNQLNLCAIANSPAGVRMRLLFRFNQTELGAANIGGAWS